MPRTIIDEGRRCQIYAVWQYNMKYGYIQNDSLKIAVIRIDETNPSRLNDLVAIVTRSLGLNTNSFIFNEIISTYFIFLFLCSAEFIFSSFSSKVNHAVSLISY